MILVDSSVWIDYLRGAPTVEVLLLDRLIGNAEIAVGDLILTEVLQGCAELRDLERVRLLLTTLPVIALAGEEIAVLAARHYQVLRGQGITVRKTIDMIIATKCIVGGLQLLHSDRDFDPFVEYLGLQVVV